MGAPQRRVQHGFPLQRRGCEVSCPICNSPETGRCPGLSIMFECESWTDELGQFRPGKLCARENEVEPENGGGEVNNPSKGPWFAETPPSCCRWMFDVRSESGKTVALIGYGEYSKTPQEERANARLIASAPTMLAALERVAEWFKRHGTAETQGIACDVFQAIDAAKGNP